MSTLAETSRWEEAIYELRTADPVLGGSDGISNRQAAQLANRTQWLKARLEAHRLEATAHLDEPDPHPQYREATQALGLALDRKLAEAKDAITQLESQLAARQYHMAAPVGTRLVLAQSSAPTGWTKETAFHDAALRLVSGTANDGGVIPFTEAFASKGITGSIGETTLSEAQMAAHSHYIPCVSWGEHISSSATGFYGSYIKNNIRGYYPASSGYPDNAGKSEAHTHSLTIESPDLRVRYVDVIIASKDFDN